MRSDRNEEESGRQMIKQQRDRTILAAAAGEGPCMWDRIADVAFPNLGSGHRYWIVVMALGSLRNRGLLQKNAVTRQYSITSAGAALLAA